MMKKINRKGPAAAASASVTAAVAVSVAAVAVTAAAVFCGCARKQAAGGGSLEGKDITTLQSWGKAAKEAFGGQTVTAAMAAHPSTDAFRGMEKEFTELTGIKVVWDVVEETSLKNKQLLDAQGAGSYDVLMVDAFWMSEYASKNVLEPVQTYTDNGKITPPWFDYNDIMPAYRNGIAGANGVNYGIPTAGETRFIAYRADLFSKYGKEPPKTMDEYLELARFFNGKDGVYGVSMRAQRGIHFASGWMSIMYNFGGGFMDQAALGEGRNVITVTTPQTVESLRFYVDLLKNAPPDVGAYTHEEALGAYLSGKTAMWLDATALANQITNPETSMVADKTAFVPTPTGPGGDGAALAGWNLAIAQKSPRKNAAWAFITFMASREKSAAYVKAGGVATRESVFGNAELAALNPSYPAQKAALVSANGLVEKGLSWIPQSDKIGQILDIAGAHGSAALAGTETVEAAAQAIQKECEDIVK